MDCMFSSKISLKRGLIIMSALVKKLFRSRIFLRCISVRWTYFAGHDDGFRGRNLVRPAKPKGYGKIRLTS